MQREYGIAPAGLRGYTAREVSALVKDFEALCEARRAVD
jgi:hypothetical protein